MERRLVLDVREDDRDALRLGGTYVLGSATDRWGRTWGASNFTNANFRVRVITISSSRSRDFSLDWIAVRVHYTG